MIFQNLKAVYFSPTKSTKDIVNYFVSYMHYENELINITPYKNRENSYNFSSKELAVIAFPVYGGRVPVPFIRQFNKIKANNTPCIIIAVYGNRNYDDALLEIKDLSKKAGFIPLAFCAFIAKHSIMNQVAVNRPDEKDKACIKEFAETVENKIVNINSIEDIKDIQVPGCFPYRSYNGLPLKPKGDKKCNKCKACALHCPVNAIPMDNPKVTDTSKCITCMGCVTLCPEKARHLNKFLHYMAERKFVKKYSDRKEPELFI